MSSSPMFAEKRHSPPQCDDILVRAAQAGDEAAFEELWKRHSDRMLRLVLRITRNREDAEDALQDAFLSAYSHLPRFEARARFSTWMSKIAVNSALLILRRRRKRPTVSIDTYYDAGSRGPLELEDPKVNVEQSHLNRERGPVLHSAIGLLPPNLSSVLRHQLLNECPVAETAQTLGLSLPATKTRLTRARKSLRRFLIAYK